MPTPTYVSVRAALKAKLDTLTGGGQKLVAVFDHHKASLPGYPSITFDVSDTENDFLTNKENLRSIAFQIVIYQEAKIKTLDEATDILDKAADDVVAAIEADFQLGGAVDWCEPLNGPRLQFATPDGLIVTQQLTLKCLFSC